jgi:hypothetical protein
LQRAIRSEIPLGVVCKVWFQASPNVPAGEVHITITEHWSTEGRPAQRATGFALLEWVVWALLGFFVGLLVARGL